MSSITMKALQEQIDALKLIVESQGNEIETLKEAALNSPKVRDRGPVSEGEMTEKCAIRCMLGDLKDTSHKDAALALKLSYGQIYSARKGYTFKKIYQRMIKGELDNSCDAPIDKDVLAAEAVEALEEIQQEGEA